MTGTTGIDWGAIRERYQGGESARALARASGVSHTAILKRAKKEGWDKAISLPPVTVGDIVLGARNDMNKQSILDDLSSGVLPWIAAKAVGMSESDLEAWMRDEPEFLAQASAAKARGYGDLNKAWVAAGMRGDWRAIESLFGRLKDTKDDFAPPAKESGTVNVVFNFSRDAPPEEHNDV